MRKAWFCLLFKTHFHFHRWEIFPCHRWLFHEPGIYPSPSNGVGPSWPPLPREVHCDLNSHLPPATQISSFQFSPRINTSQSQVDLRFTRGTVHGNLQNRLPLSFSIMPFAPLPFVYNRLLRINHTSLLHHTLHDQINNR